MSAHRWVGMLGYGLFFLLNFPHQDAIDLIPHRRRKTHIQGRQGKIRPRLHGHPVIPHAEVRRD